MTFRRLLAGWKHLSQPLDSGRSPRARRLELERLEAREVPAVVLRDIPDTDAPKDLPIFLPVTATNTPAGAVSFTATSNNAGVSATVAAAGTSLRLNVSGTDSSGQAFTGTLTIKLFTDIAPLATGTIVALANDGFYNGKLFHRVLDGFVAQGGSPNGDGIGGSSRPDVADEFNRDFTFASPGIVAMANAKDDNNNSQFFITDVDTALSQRPQFLNFNHSIVGLLTSGFDTFQRIMTTPVTTSSGGEKSQPVNPVTITSATVFEDTTNGVVRITPSTGVTGNVSVTVTGSDGTGGDGTETVNLNILPVNVGQDLQPVNSRAILGPVSNLTIAKNSPGTFTLTGTDIDSDTLTFAVGVPGNLSGTPANATVSVDQATGIVTVTPTAGFTGDIQLLVGVRDQVDRSGSLNAQGNFDTQALTVTVRDAAAVTGTLTASRTTVGINLPVLLTATFTGNGENATGTVAFFANGTQIGSSQLVTGQARFTATFAAAGTQSVQAKYTPADNLFLPGETSPLTITVSTDAPVNVPLTAIGAEPGSPPTVRVTDSSSGAELFNFLAFESSFTGGVRAATADVNGDEQDDIIAVPRFGGAPLIRVFDGNTGNLLGDVMIFEDTFRGGLYIDVGDGFERGYSQILVGAGFSGGPRITLYDFVQSRVLLNYFGDDPGFRGGISVSMSDLQANGKQHIIAGVGKGGGPIVSVYDAMRSDGFPVPNKLGAFLAGDALDRTGIRVGATGIIDGNHRNILVGDLEPDSAPLDRQFDPIAQGIFVS